MAFMKLAQDQRDEQGQLTNPVRFTGADMIKLLRLTKAGFHYDEINDWCKRMVATTIMSESSVFLAKRKQYASDTFHVFDRVVLVGEELHDGSRSENYQVSMSQWQLDNLNNGHCFPLDFNAYLNLKRDIAKALFGHLSIWFYASKGQAIEKRYQDLCNLMGIRAYPHLSKARSVLEPSLKELVDIGYLSDWEFTRTSKGLDFKLGLTPGRRLLSLPNFVGAITPEASAALEAQLPQWVPELVRRGVTDRKARQLAFEVSDTQSVMDQIEYADHLITQDQRTRSKISNPSGFYIWTIEQNLPVPESFITSQKRQRLEAREQQIAVEQVRLLELKEQYEQFRREQVQQRWESAFTVDQQQSLIRDRLKVLKREQPEWFTRLPESTRQEVALGLVYRSLEDEISFPTFDSWSKKNSQLRMF
jgi:hypothetical protein